MLSRVNKFLFMVLAAFCLPLVWGKIIFFSFVFVFCFIFLLLLIIVNIISHKYLIVRNLYSFFCNDFVYVMGAIEGTRQEENVFKLI